RRNRRARGGSARTVRAPAGGARSSERRRVFRFRPTRTPQVAVAHGAAKRTIFYATNVFAERIFCALPRRGCRREIMSWTKYTRDHQWIRGESDGGLAVGITAFAA